MHEATANPVTEPSEPPWLSHGVGGIGAASFLADLGHEIPTALLPNFLVSTLGAPAAALGVVEGLADALAGVGRLVGGALADDPQRRRVTAIGGYTATAALSALIGVTTTVWQAGSVRGGAWFARGLRVPARNALLADIVHPSAYGRAYGFERAMDNLGAIVGPLLALGLVTVVSVRTTILLSVVPGLLAAYAIYFAIRATPRPTVRERQPFGLRVRPVARGRLGRLLAGVAAFELGNVAATLLILRATQLMTPAHGQHRAVQLGLVLYAGYNAVAAIVSVPGGRLVDRRSGSFVFAIGVGSCGVAYVGLALARPSFALLLVLFLAARVGIGLVETAQNAAVASLAPVPVRGSAFGVLAAAQSFGNLGASAVAGVLWTAVSPQAAFFYLAAWMAVALPLLTAAVRDRAT